ncbi:MAG: YaaL family protein [Clostridiales bacterium]|uniref:YaaL family protein n=1 Tax=Clostridium sp. N3C TaxID=1776758 RepID=UPI00092DFEBF|nr:YaaL family protein [Clostridium sp. N3C]NLZ49695.1 YaaL family protein [Clostridiales bacterium]SCN25983.1 hypothetical protein N3C_2617 [Clostridium sp. N3C]
MDKQKIIEYIFNNAQKEDNEEEIITAIEDAVNQIELARNFFENVSEPKLVDYAIYLEEAAKARYEFLLSEAKRRNIRVKQHNIIVEAI